MAFLPFGYRFEIRGPTRPQNTKAAIRARLKSWFDMKPGARGWIAGPFFCLWSNAFNRNGPMVLGRIVEDGFATRIAGRAGSDLNGLIWMVVLTAVFLSTFVPQTMAGDTLPREMLLYGGIFGVMLPFVLWLSHSDRHEADHLVKFLEDVMSPGAKARRAATKSVQVAKKFKMDVSGEKASEAVTGDSIYETLLATGIGDFVILASDEESYIQTLGQEAGLIIENRKGGADEHFRAVRRSGAKLAAVAHHFSFEETWEVVSAYVSDSTMPTFFKWERMSVGTDPYAGE